MKGQDEAYMPQAPPPYPGDNVPPPQPYSQPPVGFAAPAPGFDPPHGTTFQKQEWTTAPMVPGGHTTIVTSPVQVIHVQGYGPDPIQIACPHCNATVLTSTKPVSGTLTWLVAGGLCLLGCWLGCCLIPFCVDGCQDIEHRCPNCKALLGIYRRL